MKAQPSKFLSANNPANKFKNRLVNILPCKSNFFFLFEKLNLFSDENTRVCLSPIRGVEGSDYINASYIDVSEKKRKIFFFHYYCFDFCFSRVIDLKMVILLLKDH